MLGARGHVLGGMCSGACARGHMLGGMCSGACATRENIENMVQFGAFGVYFDQKNMKYINRILLKVLYHRYPIFI